MVVTAIQPLLLGDLQNSSKLIRFRSTIPKHTANVAKTYLDRKAHSETLSIMDWRPQSPDLNINKAVWDQLDRMERKAANIQRRPLNVIHELFLKTI